MPRSKFTIRGSGFGDAQGLGTVYFGSSYAEIDTWSDTSISAYVPKGLPAGKVTVSVKGTSGADAGGSQYNPYGATHANVHWGHFRSPDLLTWEPLPIALSPTPGGLDTDGCFSGNAVSDGDRLVAFYSAHREDRSFQHQPVTCAVSHDGGRTFRPRGELLIPELPEGCTMYRDPYVWQDGDGWRMLVGAALADGRAAALLYDSPDLETWTYRGPFAAREKEPVSGTDLDTGEGWECPQYLPATAADGRCALDLQRMEPTHRPAERRGPDRRRARRPLRGRPTGTRRLRPRLLRARPAARTRQPVAAVGLVMGSPRPSLGGRGRMGRRPHPAPRDPRRRRRFAAPAARDRTASLFVRRHKSTTSAAADELDRNGYGCKSVGRCARKHAGWQCRHPV